MSIPAPTGESNAADNQQIAIEESMRRNMEKLRFELGPVICNALDDPKVTEIMVNPPDGRIFLDRLVTGMEDTGENIPEPKLLAGIGTIAAILKTEVNNKYPLLKGELPIGGARIQATISPASKTSGITIRKHARMVFPLNQYVEEKRLTEEGFIFLRESLRSRKNILIVGGTGSGKTTFANSLLAMLKEICPMDRIVMLEDTYELQCKMRNHYSLCTVEGVTEEDKIDMQMLVETSLRMRPDRIVVGEVRNGAALDLLKSWNTGHPGGICTIHANSAEGALSRLELLILEVSVGSMKALIGEAINIIVFLKKIAKIGPVVTEIMVLNEFNNQTGEYEYDYFQKSEEFGF
ncbi:MAG: P-type conjugative transfer ATPase TrbB [Holosporaceae bacterium]|nr:P-type conjugative transfer ATPase TrbB [Holosporaceae bacterium]